MSIIATHNLTKSYGRRTGIERVDLTVDEGMLFGFLGPNGAGKTTAIRVLLGFLRPDGGEARVLGHDCWRASHRVKRDVGYVPGDLRLYPWMTGANALKVVGRIRGTELGEAGHRLAERFGLEMGVRSREMSKGMRQKLGLILALAPDPKLLVLDEPTSGLDPLMQQVLADLLRDRARRGRTVFFSSHTLSEVEQLCDRVAIVRKGKLVADETLDDMRRRARREVTIVFDDADGAARLEPPVFLTRLHRDGRTWRAELTGPARPLLEWLATRPVHDVVVREPDLETIFRQFYEDDPEEAGADTP